CFDPEGPVRYKHISVTGEGIATALAEAFVANKDISLYAEMLVGNHLSFWLSVLAEFSYDVAPLMTRFEACRGHMRQQGPGFGLERVCISVNPDTPCLSPIVSRFYCRTPEEFLLARRR
ncbi:MAG: hypothetical protein HC902_15080, partial [Calothrix sp. SM1_5_4]|nr:hypothetical protein [Calothrix sp. SM1_5_4]